MKIAIFGTNFSEQYTKYITHLLKKMDERGVEIIIYEEFFNFLEESIDLNEKIKTFNKINADDNIDELLLHLDNSVKIFDYTNSKVLSDYSAYNSF